MGIGVMRYRARMIGAQLDIKRIESDMMVRLAMAFEADRGAA